MNKPDISVIIPTYNREAELIDAIEAILAQSHQNLELLILDQSNKPQPAKEKFIASVKDSRLRYIKITPPSLPAARNFGLHAAQSPIVLFLDDDIKIGKDLIKFHLQAYQEHPDISA